MSRPIPVTLIGGWLGAGKTTLVNHLLRHRGDRRLTVLVNDFGDLPIDADLVDSREGDVLQLAGGCVCCSFGSDLMGALLRVAESAVPPDRLLLETSGVALPVSVARTIGLLPSLEVDAIVVVADAATLGERAADAYVGDLVRDQLAGADIVLLNQVDRLSPEARAPAAQLAATLSPRARVHACERARIDPALLSGARRAAVAPPSADQLARVVGTAQAEQRSARTAAARKAPPRPARLAAAPTAASRFESLALPLPDAADVSGLAAVLADPRWQLLRAKGRLLGRDGRVHVVHFAGGRVDVAEAPASPTATLGLVCVGLRGRLDTAALAGALLDAAG